MVKWLRKTKSVSGVLLTKSTYKGATNKGLGLIRKRR